MYIKGTAFLARKRMVLDDHSPEAWSRFMSRYRTVEPYFETPVVATSRIPAEKFLAWSDALLVDLYKGDKMIYWRMGEKAAEWALAPSGPYGTFRASDPARFVSKIPDLWTLYYSEGGTTCEFENNRMLISVHTPHRHIHFEYSVIGFCKRALEVVSVRNVSTSRIKGFSKGDFDVVYTLTIG